jgi:hypothetical protein
MAKFMTKRSLGVAAAGSLAFASLVAAPAAYAVDPITTVPEEGTLYAVTDATDFNLKAQITNAALNGGNEVLKWRIVDADGGLTNAGIDLGDGNGAPLAPNGVLEQGDDALGVFADGVAVVASTLNAAGGTSVLILDPADGADSFTVTVQAWMDFDGDGAIDTAAGSEEVAGPVRTVTFYDDDDVTYVTSLTQPALGDANLVATVASSPSVNTEQSAAVSVGFATLANGAYAAVNNGTTVNAAGDFTAGVALADGKYTTAHGGANGVTAANYVAVAIQGGAEAGTEVVRTVAAGLADGIGAISLVDTADINGLNVRTGTSAITAQVKVTDNNVALAGATVTWSLNDGANFGADTVVTAGGKTLKDDDADALTVTSVTGADGVATLPISIAGQTAAAAALITIDAKVDAVNPAVQVTVVLVDEDAASINDYNILGKNGINQVASGSTFSLSVVALDNLGEGLSGSGWRVKLDNSLAGANLVTKFASLNSSGVATFSVTDHATNVETWDATVQKWNANAGTWDDTLVTVDVTPSIGTSITGANITSIADATPTIAKVDLAAADERLGAAGPVGGNKSAEITGTVTASTGAVGFTTVTISAPGVLFEVETTQGAAFVYQYDSVTVMTTAAGVYGGVKAMSNTAGAVTVKVTSGSASEDVELTFGGVTADEAAALDVSLANAEAGKTMTVTATVTDKFGNPVNNDQNDLRITYTGPGFVNGTLPNETGADGTAEFRVLIGTNDALTGSVKVELDHDSDVDFTDDGTIVVTKDLAPAAAADTKVNAGSFKGYVAVYAKGHEGKRLSAKIGNDWVVVESLASNFERIVDFTGAGYTISVRIYIDRVLEDTIVVTTK